MGSIPSFTSEVFSDEGGESSSPRPLYIAAFFNPVLLEPTLIRSLSDLLSIEQPKLIEASSFEGQLLVTLVAGKHESTLPEILPEVSLALRGGIVLQTTASGLPGGGTLGF